MVAAKVPSVTGERSAPTRDDARLRAMVDEHVDVVARVLRRLGVPEADVDDAVQTVFLTASRRLHEIEPHAERAFLYRTALNEAMHARRSLARRKEDPEGELPALDPSPSAEELVDRRRAAALLEQILGSMPEELRAVFVFFEIEQLTTAEIAALVEIPEGTVASRLRRAREDFRARVERARAQQSRGGRS